MKKTLGLFLHFVGSVSIRIFGAVLLFIFSHSLVRTGGAFGQTQFQLAVGATSSDVAHFIVQTTDGGYAVAGYTVSFGAGSNDMYIVKLDASGTLQWSRTVGGTGIDYANSMVQTTDGGYAVAGRTSSFGSGLIDIYIVNLDANGTLQWSRTVGGTSNDNAYSIIQTTDGGYAVAGYTVSFGAGSYDMYIVKLDSSGTVQWSRTVGGTGIDNAYCIIQTTDSGYAMAGYTSSFGAGNYDVYIVKLDASGTLQWSRTVGGTGIDNAISIIQTTDSGYAVAGYTVSFGAGSYDVYIVKLDASGTLQWSRTVGGTGSDYAISIVQTTDGKYVVAGNTSSFGAGSYDMYIVKLDSSGTVQWSRTVGGTNDEYVNPIIQTTDGGYAVAGETRSFGAGLNDMYIVKLNAGGNTCGNSTSPSSTSGSGGNTTNPTSTINTPTPTVFSPTSSTFSGGTVAFLCSVVGIQPISNEIPSKFKLEQNYPNPFNPVTTIEFDLPISSFVRLSVYDVTGREIEVLANENLSAGKYEVKWDAGRYSSGVYFYRLITDGFVKTNKMMLIK